MGTVSVSLPSDGTTADVSDYNTPIQAIVDEINGELDNSNIAAAAAIAGSKLADNGIDIEAKASSDSGWREVTDSWTYASATTITVPSDATTKYSVGDKIRLSQTTVKYFYVTAVAATTLTVTGGSDYTVANAAITDISYSKAETPLGFPNDFTWTPTLSGRFDDADWTKTCRFSMHGKDVDFAIKLVATAAAPMGGGTADAIFTLPVTASGNYESSDDHVPVIGMGNLRDTGTTIRLASVSMASTTTALFSYITTGLVPAAIDSTTPYTFTTNDEVMGSGSYKAA